MRAHALAKIRSHTHSRQVVEVRKDAATRLQAVKARAQHAYEEAQGYLKELLDMTKALEMANEKLWSVEVCVRESEIVFVCVGE